MPEQVLLAVGLDQRNALVGPAGQSQVGECQLVDREEAAGRAVLGGHVPDRGAVGQREAREPGAEVLHELADDAGLPQQLGDRQHEVSRGRALAQAAVEPHADDLRHEHRQLLAEQRGLGLDSADTPAEHAEAVDHRRVRVGADQRVREDDAVAFLDHAREVLEIDLVDNARVRRDDLQVVEGALAPAQEGVALAVALVVAVDVGRDRHPRGEGVDLHRVVDHQLGRDVRVDLRRVAAEVGHRAAHRGDVDDRGNAGEVLQQHARGAEAELAARLVLRLPLRDRLDAALGLEAERVLEQDPERVGQPLDVLDRPERRVGKAQVSGAKGGGCSGGHASTVSTRIPPWRRYSRSFGVSRRTRTRNSLPSAVTVRLGGFAVLEARDRELLAAGQAQGLEALAVHELERDDPAHQQVRAVDPLVALGDRRAHAEQVRALRGPVA